MRYHTRSGYTLVELLLSTALGLMILAAVVQMFSVMGGTINDSRAALAMNEDLRRVAAQLRSDLDGLTVVPDPPRPPENGEGYLQIIEGPIGVWVAPDDVAVDTDTDANTSDTTVGDTDDILLFTSRKEEGFQARKDSKPCTFDAAEVAWFMRGNKLYRKVLGIDADQAMSGVLSGSAAGFFEGSDISVNAVTAGDSIFYERNTLASLTRPDCRYGSLWNSQLTDVNGVGLWHFAFGRDGKTSLWCPSAKSASGLPGLGLPLAAEAYCDTGDALTSGPIWKNATQANLGSAGTWDMWRNPIPWGNISPQGDILKSCAGESAILFNSRASGKYRVSADRIGEDLVMANVLSFDVKVWDPSAQMRSVGKGIPVDPSQPGWSSGDSVIGYGAFVDLGYDPSHPDQSDFSDVRDFVRTDFTARNANGSVQKAADSSLPRVYDTWSTHYETELNAAIGLQHGVYRFTAPYMKPLRGIQVVIRAFDPDSRQIRQVTLIQAFRR